MIVNARCKAASAANSGSNGRFIYIKHWFEICGSAMAAAGFGRILLDPRHRNAYKKANKRRGLPVRTFVALSLLIVSRRTAEGG